MLRLMLGTLLEDKDDGKNLATLEAELKTLWVETGDAISMQYTGTCSNISTVTKSEQKGLIGKLT